MKDLIKQYVSTGVRITEYQFNKLSNNLLNTYFKYTINLNELRSYEFSKLYEMDKSAANKYITNISGWGIGYLVRYTKEEKYRDHDWLYPLLLNNKNVINNLDAQGLEMLIMYSGERKIMTYDTLLNNELLMRNLDEEMVDELIGYTSSIPEYVGTINAALKKYGYDEI